MSRPETEKDMEVVRAMIHCHLNSLAAVKAESIFGDAHLDEDAMSAFVEGLLSENENRSIITHLTSCGSCRDFTARLIRIESTFTAEDESKMTEEAPSRLRRFLEGIASRVIPSGSE